MSECLENHCDEDMASRVIYFICLLLLVPVASFVVPSTRLHKQRKLYLIDPNLLQGDGDTLQSGINAFVNSFESTIKFKAIGTAAGTVSAGLIFAYITSSISKNVFQSKKKKNTSKNNETKVDIPTEAWIKLLFCLSIDLLGDVSFLLPGIGEAEDIAWAPVSSFILSQLFGGNTAIVSLEFISQILPVGATDAIPVATIAWLLQYVYKDSSLSKLLNMNPTIIPLVTKLTKENNKKK